MFLNNSNEKSYDSKVWAIDVDLDCYYREGSKICSPTYYYQVDGIDYKCTDFYSTETTDEKT